MPGRDCQFTEDFDKIKKWQPNLVLTIATIFEMVHKNATQLPIQLSEAGIDWLHFPIEDFDAPDGKTNQSWIEIANCAHKVLDQGGKVLAHCMGGQGRSGMAILRLMVERGISPKIALKQIRTVRPMAVETNAQYKWAARG
jgi:protein-tyrosine phosphatase